MGGFGIREGVSAETRAGVNSDSYTGRLIWERSEVGAKVGRLKIQYFGTITLENSLLILSIAIHNDPTSPFLRGNECLCPSKDTYKNIIAKVGNNPNELEQENG